MVERDKQHSRPQTQHNIRIRWRHRETRFPGQHNLLLLGKQLALQSFRDTDFVLAGDLGKNANTLRKSKALSDATPCPP